jgi:hypothetical protein
MVLIRLEVNMGCIKGITFAEFPKQGKMLGATVSVCFHYDTSKCIDGKIIRDDMEEPFETIIQLVDGRVVRGVECQYS